MWHKQTNTHTQVEEEKRGVSIFLNSTEYTLDVYMAQTNKHNAQAEEEKRGVFSGVETSICYGMDLLKFVLVRTKISSHSRTL